MKKNIYKSIALVALLITSSACNEDFLEPEIFSEIGKSNFFQTSDDVESILIGTYAQLQDELNNRHWDWGEARSDNFRKSRAASGGDELDLIENNINPTSDSADWGGLFNVVSGANLIIANAPNIEGVDGQLIGEAHALRAFSYFNMIRIWGDVPAWVDGADGISGDINLPRTDMDVIMSSIILPDLERAEALLTTSGGSGNKARFNRSSILALKAHVYAWMGGAANWQIASDAVDDLSGDYSLVTSREDWRDMFTEVGGEDGPELIFSIVFDFDTDGNSEAHGKLNDGSLTFMFSQSLGNKWQDKFPTTQAEWEAKYPGFMDRDDIGIDQDDPDLTDPLSPLYGDWRLKESAQFLESRFDNSRTMLKYVKQRNQDDGRDESAVDYPIYRLAGLLLLKAEMQVKLGNTGAAVDIVNDIRVARELPEELPADFTNTTDALNLVLDERQFELYGEAQRWWDLRRNDLVFETVLNDGESLTFEETNVINEGDPIFSAAAPGKILWPIGNRVISLNKSISSANQNPDY